MTSRHNHLYEFGPFRLDTAERSLTRGGQLVPLTPKAYETLLVLVRNSGHIMEKEQLLKEIWRDTFVEEATLAQNVFTLRKALDGGENEGKKYIETIPRRGYRFVAEVREVSIPDPRQTRDAQQTPDESATTAAHHALEMADAHAATGTPETTAEKTFGAARETTETTAASALRETAIRASTGGAHETADESAAVRGHEAYAASGEGAEVVAGGAGAFGAAAQDEDAARPDEHRPAAAQSVNGDGAIARRSEADTRRIAPAHATDSAQVSTTASAQVSTASAQVSTTATSVEGESSVERRPALAAALIASVVLLAAAGVVFGLYRWSVQRQTSSRASSFQEMKVTRLPVNGSPREAVISPDGRYVAYVTMEAGESSIWVRQASANSNAQRIVAPTPGVTCAGPVFSPDGEYLYYVTFATENAPNQLARVPLLGGTATKLLTHINSPVTFAPDGKRFAFVRGDFEKKEVALVVADADGKNERAVTVRHLPEVLAMPAWSSDGELIACVVNRMESGNPSMSVVGVRASDGAEQPLTSQRWYEVMQLAWLHDASGLVMSATEEELSPSQMWLLSYPGGATRRITNDLNVYLGTSLTADSSALVTLQTDRVANLWLVPGADEARAKQITQGAGKYDGFYGVSFMPDGRIVYASVASGAWDIWTMNADGSNQKQLTVGARSNYGPDISPDGRYIVFVSNRAGGPFHIWRMNSDGEAPLQLTSGAGENFPHVSADGRFVVYATVGLNQPNQIWKVPIEGGEPVLLVKEPSSWPTLSPDGKYLACILEGAPDRQSGKLAIFPVAGGEPLKTFALSPNFRANTLWSADSRAVTYLDSAGGVTNIWAQPLDGSPPKQLTHFKADGVGAYGWSNDGKQLVASRASETTSVVLIKDFY